MTDMERIEAKIDRIFDKIEGPEGLTVNLMVLKETVRRVEQKVTEVTDLCPQHSRRIDQLESFKSAAKGAAWILGIIFTALTVIISLIMNFLIDKK